MRVDPSDPTRMTVSLPALETGVYTVSWKAVSATDGHQTEGAFTFSVGTGNAPAMPACPADLQFKPAGQRPLFQMAFVGMPGPARRAGALPVAGLEACPEIGCRGSAGDCLATAGLEPPDADRPGGRPGGDHPRPAGPGRPGDRGRAGPALGAGHGRASVHHPPGTDLADTAGAGPAGDLVGAWAARRPGRPGWGMPLPWR